MSRPSESVNVLEDSEECIRLALKSIFSTESLICGISKRRLGKHSSPNEIAVRNALQKEPGVTDVPCSLAQAGHSLQILVVSSNVKLISLHCPGCNGGRYIGK